MVSAVRWQIPEDLTGSVYELTGSVDVTVDDLTKFQVLASDGDVLVDLAMPAMRR